MTRHLCVAVASAVALVPAVAGCAEAPREPAEQPPARTTPSPEPAVPPTETSPSAPATEQPGGDVAGIGETVGSGDWAIRVREVEDRDEEDDVRPQRGELLDIEVDVRNSGSDTLSLRTSDWRLESGGQRYTPVPVDDPDDRGERQVGPNETEDVNVIFDIPTDTTDAVLVFEPSDSSGAARVRVR